MKCMHCFFFESVYEDYNINAHLVLFDSTDILIWRYTKMGQTKGRKWQFPLPWPFHSYPYGREGTSIFLCDYFEKIVQPLIRKLCRNTVYTLYDEFHIEPKSGEKYTHLSKGWNWSEIEA